MNNIPSLKKQASYIISTNGRNCPKYLNVNNTTIMCTQCICYSIIKQCFNSECIDYCKKYLKDLRKQKLKRILDE